MACEHYKCEKIKFLNDEQSLYRCERCTENTERSWDRVLDDEIRENLKAAKRSIDDIELAANTEGGDPVYEIETTINILKNLAQLYQDFYRRERVEDMLKNPRNYLPLER